MATKNSIDNTSNPLASTAVTIDPGASGDSFVQFDINATGEFRIGVDDDASDAFKISQGSALGTNDTYSISSDGNVIKPQNSCFGAYAADQANITGSGTVYSVTFTGGEFFDQGGDFASSTFTAPVTGIYLLTTSIRATGFTTSHNTYQLRITTTATNFIANFIDPGNVFDVNTDYGSQLAIITDMTAADVANVYLYTANGTKVVDITGANSYFSGCLIS